MAFRDILVLVDESKQSAARAVTAAALAAQSGATLTGLFPWSEFLQILFAGDAIAYLPATEIDKVLKDHRLAVKDAEEKARLAFEEAAREYGVPSDWRILNGADDSDIVAAARRADLCVLAHKMQPPLGDHPISAAAIGLASGGPVLIAPDGGVCPDIGRHVLVAWNGSREAARALRDAAPILARAQKVSVLIVAPRGEGAPDDLLQRHLARHQINAAVIEDRSEDAAAGEVLRRAVVEQGASLVVMGLYGHPRLQEIALGGASRSMLSDPIVPILMSH